MSYFIVQVIGRVIVIATLVAVVSLIALRLGWVH